MISNLRSQPLLKVKILILFLWKSWLDSLKTYELNFPRYNKQKSIALKSVDEVDSLDDELGSTDAAYLAKQFKIFMRNSRNRGFQNNSKNLNKKKI